MLSRADGLASKNADILILIGRILLAWVFVGVAYGAMINFAGSLAYFTSQKLYPPELWTWTALLLELLIWVSLILGIGTRYGAILVFLFVLIATAIAHRYWEFPAGPQQIGQYNNFLKNISIMGGALAILRHRCGPFLPGSRTYKIAAYLCPLLALSGHLCCIAHVRFRRQSGHRPPSSAVA